MQTDNSKAKSARPFSGAPIFIEKISEKGLTYSVKYAIINPSKGKEEVTLRNRVKPETKKNGNQIETLTNVINLVVAILNLIAAILVLAGAMLQ